MNCVHQPTPTASPRFSAHAPADGEQLAARYARTRCPQVREQAILHNHRLVEMLAARMRRRGVAMEDLVQTGTVGLIAALERYDPDRGVRFATYAANLIIGELKHYFRDVTWPMRVPRQLQELAGTLRRTNEVLARELDRAPTMGELAQRLSVSEEVIVEAMELNAAYRPCSLDARLPTSDASQRERLADLVGELDGRLAYLVDLQPLWEAMDDLEPRKRWLLRRRYLDDWSQSEVGRAMGISQMHVSRLEREALGELKETIGR